MASKSSAVAPHSWDVLNWPATVWPNEGQRAQWIVRSYRDQLLYHRALTRVGKRLVVIGCGYEKFLAAQASGVKGFRSNNPDAGRSELQRHRAA